MERALVTRLFPRAGRCPLGPPHQWPIAAPLSRWYPVLGRFDRMSPVSPRRYSSRVALDERWIVPENPVDRATNISDSSGREYSAMSSATNAHGDGKAAKRIVNALLKERSGTELSGCIAAVSFREEA